MSEKTYAQIKAEYIAAYEDSKLNSNEECTLRLEGCKNNNSYVYQKETRVIRSKYVSEEMVQTPDNFIFCCETCYHWIMGNQEEAIALGYLIR
jgi:hypothetical protein